MNLKMHILKIDTYENRKICCQIFESGSSNFILIIASAMGVKQSFYQGFSEFAEANGISVITFDYSGIGNSLNENIKDNKDFLSSWGDRDLEAVIKYSIENFPNHKKVVLGHSIGGQLIGLASSSVDLDKIILMSAQSGYWGFWKGVNKVKMFFNWHLLFPILTYFIGYMPSKKISKMENIPKNVAEEWAKWCRNPNYLFDYISEDKTFFNKIKCKITSVSFDDDFFAPKKSVDWLSGKFKNAELKRKHFFPSDFNVSKIGHFDVFKSDFKNSIWKFLLEETLITKSNFNTQ